MWVTVQFTCFVWILCGVSMSVRFNSHGNPTLKA